MVNWLLVNYHRCRSEYFELLSGNPRIKANAIIFFTLPYVHQGPGKRIIYVDKRVERTKKKSDEENRVQV